MARVSRASQLHIHEEIGRGAFGVVYRATVASSGQEVAVKQIDLEHESADFHEVYKEIQILSECQSPHITSYLGCFVNNHKLWLIMEYVDGGSMHELLKAGPVTCEEAVATLTYDVLQALVYLHGQGKIHRDLKSANILVSSAGAVKLTDFGVSTQLHSHFSRRNTTVGTPYWMAPEVINNSGGHGFSADVWSLACCVYEFCTGAPPLQNQYTPMQALRRISAVDDVAEFLGLIGVSSLGLSASAEAFFRACFAVAPESRPSPRALMSHPFLKRRLVGAARENCLNGLVTRKRRWDAENCVSSDKRFYTPTVGPADAVHFDISTISGPAGPRPKADPASRKSAEFARILSRAASRVDRSSALSDAQRSRLADVSAAMSELFASVQARDSAGASRIVVCQFLRYIIKEVRSSEVRGLQKAIVPPETAEKTPLSPMDDIERSLLQSWLDSMQERTG